MNFMRRFSHEDPGPNSHRLSAFAQDLWDLELKPKWLYLGKGLSFTSKNICIE